MTAIRDIHNTLLSTSTSNGDESRSENTIIKTQTVKYKDNYSNKTNLFRFNFDREKLKRIEIKLSEKNTEVLQLQCLKISDEMLEGLNELVNQKIYFCISEIFRQALYLFLAELDSYYEIEPDYSIYQNSISIKIPVSLLKLYNESFQKQSNSHLIFSSVSDFFRTIANYFLTNTELAFFHNYPLFQSILKARQIKVIAIRVPKTYFSQIEQIVALGFFRSKAECMRFICLVYSVYLMQDNVPDMILIRRQYPRQIALKMPDKFVKIIDQIVIDTNIANRTDFFHLACRYFFTKSPYFQHFLQK